MVELFDTRAERTDRQDLHTANVDQDLAGENMCGVTDLRTGRACHRPALHPDSCAFDSPLRLSPPDDNIVPAVEATC